MPDFHYEGQYVFGDEETRDLWFSRWQDYIDAEPGVRPEPSAAGWTAGLEKQSRANHAGMVGPAFSLSIRVPGNHYLTDDDPPQQGLAELLRAETNEVEPLAGSTNAVPIQE